MKRYWLVGIAIIIAIVIMFGALKHREDQAAAKFLNGLNLGIPAETPPAE